MYVVLQEKWLGADLSGITDVFGVFDSERKAQLFADTMNRVKDAVPDYTYSVHSLSAIPEELK